MVAIASLHTASHRLFHTPKAYSIFFRAFRNDRVYRLSPEVEGDGIAEKVLFQWVPTINNEPTINNRFMSRFNLKVDF